MPLLIIIGHFCWKLPNIISATTSIMDTVISYETVKALVANPPSLGDWPNFFNLQALRNHFARTLKRITCPQSPVNGWAGFVLTPVMYALIDPTIRLKIVEPADNHRGIRVPPNLRRRRHDRHPLHVHANTTHHHSVHAPEELL